MAESMQTPDQHAQMWLPQSSKWSKAFSEDWRLLLVQVGQNPKWDAQKAPMSVMIRRPQVVQHVV